MKQPLVAIFDPVVNAYRQVPLDIAKKYVETLKAVEKEVKKALKEAKAVEEFNQFKKQKND